MSSNWLRAGVFASAVLLLCLGCSEDKSTTPQPKIPTVTTAGMSSITPTTAVCGGMISSDGGAAVTARGVCWGVNAAPTVADSKTTDGVGTGSFSSSISGLTPSSPYYVRAYATNSVGTEYGEAEYFQTLAQTSTVSDIDGNVYQTITIGTQEWMAENLKVTHYRNGDPIQLVTDGTSWQSLSTGAYCEYDNDGNNVAAYGRLYNWFAVNDSIAPAGWHVPTDTEWQTLIDYLGGDAVAGGKMKEAGTAHWLTPNTDATNLVGFNGLPGGYRVIYGEDLNMTYNALFWSSTESDSYVAWYRTLSYDEAGVYHDDYTKIGGLSVRCVKD